MKSKVARSVLTSKPPIIGVQMDGTEWRIGCVPKRTRKYKVVLNGTKKVKFKFLIGVLLKMAHNGSGLGVVAEIEKQKYQNGTEVK